MKTYVELHIYSLCICELVELERKTLVQLRFDLVPPTCTFVQNAMLRRLPSCGRDLQSHRFLIARIVRDMAIRAYSSGVGRDDESMLTATDPYLLRRIRDRYMGKTTDKRHVPDFPNIIRN